MELKPGYRQTEVGLIPEEWDVQACAGVCVKIQDGTHFSPSSGGNDYLYVTSKNIGFGVLDVSNADRIDAAQHKAIYERCDVRHGDLLLTKDGANTGNAALNTLEEEFSLLSSVAFLRFDPKRHTPGYFLQQILSNPGQRRIKDAMAGNAITRLTLDKIRKLRFPVAPLPEQRAIAVVLGDLDALIGALHQLIAKKRDLKQAAMQQLLTGQTRLPGFHGEWKVKRLRDAAEIIMGQSPDSRHYNRSGDGVPLIQGNADIEGRRSIARVWTTEVTKEGRKGDLLLTVRAPVGSIGIISERSCLGRGVCALRPQDNCADFMFQALILAERAWKFLEQGSTFTSANSAQVAAFALPMPPSFSEQAAIAVVLSDMDAGLAALEKRREKTLALKQGMMQELLTGRTRLV